MKERPQFYVNVLTGCIITRPQMERTAQNNEEHWNGSESPRMISQTVKSIKPNWQFGTLVHEVENINCFGPQNLWTLKK